MTIYQKIIAAYGLILNSIGMRAARTELAPNFDAGKTYQVGRLVVYDKKLYRCTVQHTGAWDATHFVQTTIDEAYAQSGSGSITGVKVNGTSLTPVSGVVDVQAITGVKVNGSAKTPSAGVVDVQAITGVKVNNSPVEPENGSANISAITGVKVNNTQITPVSGVANITAVTGIVYGGQALPISGGSVTIPTTSADWNMSRCSDGNIALNTVNEVDYSQGDTLNLVIPAGVTGKSRCFSLCLRNLNGASPTSIIDSKTGEQALVRWYYNGWAQQSMTNVISEKINSEFCVYPFYEVVSGIFTLMDIH